jgi:hypothetical protein
MANCKYQREQLMKVECRLRICVGEDVPLGTQPLILGADEALYAILTHL